MEEVPAFVWREEIVDFADGLDELIEGPGSDASEVRLEFREGHLDRVEIRTAGRNRKQHPWALSIRVAVSLLWVARLSRMTTDPGSSSGIGTFSMQLSKASRSRAPEITRGATVPPQDRPAIKVRFAPSPKRRAAFEPFTTWTALLFAGHPGVGARLIQKDQPLRLPARGLLSTAPVMPCFSNLWLAALPGDQAFLICVAMARRRSASIPLVEHLMLWAAKRAARNSTRVMSGSCPISSTKNETNESGLPLPLRGTDGNGSRGAPSRTCLPQRAAVAGLNKSILPAAAARNPVHQIPETDPKGHRQRIPHGTSFHTG